MAEVAKLLYIVVLDEEDIKKDEQQREKYSFRYTRPVLQSTLQLMGCKPRHSFKISKRVFEVMRTQRPSDMSGLDGSKNKPELISSLGSEEDTEMKRVPFELYKRRTTVVIKRETFLDVVCDALAEYKYLGPKQRADLVLACRIRERKESVTVLLCGTSGCGKSTLSALLASRLGITTVISTDSIRHMMRSFVDEKQNPLLWSSTYHAGEHLDTLAVSKAKAKRKAKKLERVSHSPPMDEGSDAPLRDKLDSNPTESGSTNTELISPKQMAVEGFKAQSEMVIDSLDRLITAWEERKESVVVEGVHLSLNFVMGLMKKHPSIIPFMVYITNEDKHLERFAVRAKYMTLDPAKNKYVKYIRNIRTIQDYLCKRADKHLVPKVNNTNVDKSVASIHATVFSSLRRREGGEQLYDPTTNTVSLIYEEYRNQCTANSLSSKGMFQMIQRQGSSRQLMALFNNDGSVAKAWSVVSVDDNGKPVLSLRSESGLGDPMDGPLMISKAEPINIQFGLFGISAWPRDAGGTSHASSVDETETSSKYFSSCCSSPRMSEAHDKELKEEQSVNGSDEEEVDDQPEMESDEDLSDVGNEHVHEMEGSVDEESKSDEEYDDLAMQDVQDNGSWSVEADEYRDRLLMPVYGSAPAHGGFNPREVKYRQNLDNFLKNRNEQLSEPPSFFSSLLLEKNEKKGPHSGYVRNRKRSLSIPALGKHGSLDSIMLSGAPIR